MSRKNSLLEISKAYEQILNEMNIGIPSSAQNPLMSQDDPEEMAAIANAGDQQHQSCQACETGQCDAHAEEGQNVVINNADDPSQITFTATAPQQSGDKEEGEEEHDVYDNSNLEMAKSEVYKILKCADELMLMLKKSPKMEAWMLSKLVKASDFVSSVKDVLDYDIYDKEMCGCMDDLSDGMHLVGQITSMLNGEGKEVNEAVIKRAKFNLEIIRNK